MRLRHAAAVSFVFAFFGFHNLIAQPKELNAEDVYRNVEIFKGKAAVRLLPAMVAINGLLGVQCTYCHTQFEWDKEDKDTKQTARKMFHMIEYLNTDHFGGQNRISCWTCHRGHAKPLRYSPDPTRLQTVKDLIGVPSADEAKPSQEVFHNIQTLKGVPAGRFPLIMAMFSKALGTDCSHCHVEGQWSKDDVPAKATARKMLGMVGATMGKFFGGNGSLGCYTCHQEKVQPELTPKG